MKEIKQIRIEDCVECYVSTIRDIITQNDPKAYIAYKTLDGGYVDTQGEYWLQAIPCSELDNPPKPKWSDKYPKEWSIHAKIFKALSEGAVVRHINEKKFIFNNFNTVWALHYYQICTNYTGTESDVWEEIE